MSDGLSMILATAIVTLVSVAIANQLGPERDGEVAALGSLTGLRVFAANPAGTPGHVPALARPVNDGAARTAP